MSVFQKLSDFVVETSEQALKIFEEGSAILMSGDSPNNNDGGSTGGFNGKTDAQDNSNFIDELPDDYLESDSPLNGLAENVLSDIMKNQVRGGGGSIEKDAIFGSFEITLCVVLFTLYFHCPLLIKNLHQTVSTNINVGQHSSIQICNCME